MKNLTSGNGVKVANRFAIVNKIEGKRTWYADSIKNIKASELLPVWNYKAEGLNLDQAKQELINVINVRKEKADTKRKSINKINFFKLSVTPNHKNKYADLAKEKQRSITEFNTKFATLEPVQNYSKWSYGSYQYQHRSFRMDNMIVSIKWAEESDWNFYAKSYRKPKNTYSDRQVTFSKLGKLGKTEVVFTYPLATFAGQFMEKAIAAFFRISKVKCQKELKSIQLADFYSLTETNAINGYRLFQRFIGSHLWDYAILDTKTGVTYHSLNQDSLVSGLRAKLNAKLETENELITKEVGFKLGFCETGMNQFCSDNGVNYEGEYTRSDLRNIVIKNRADNYRKYRIELAQIGISIGK